MKEKMVLGKPLGSLISSAIAIPGVVLICLIWGGTFGWIKAVWALFPTVILCIPTIVAYTMGLGNGIAVLVKKEEKTTLDMAMAIAAISICVLLVAFCVIYFFANPITVPTVERFM